MKYYFAEYSLYEITLTEENIEEADTEQINDIRLMFAESWEYSGKGAEFKVFSTRKEALEELAAKVERDIRHLQTNLQKLTNEEKQNDNTV